MIMHISEDLQKELDFFKRTNEHFVIEAGKATTEVKYAADEVLYMTMSTSLVKESIRVLMWKRRG